ncbi:MAG: hypothetical protein HFG72_05220 [Hungatella sp.]|jgi:hypothetical protein|nr:hypothetical protein [Hungatella sp.]
MNRHDLRWYEKLNIFVGIVAAIFAIAGYTLRDFIGNPPTTEETTVGTVTNIEATTKTIDEATTEMIDKATTETTDETTTEATDETTTESVVETHSESVVDTEEEVPESVEEEVRRIRKEYYSFQEEKENLKRDNIISDVVIYYKEDRVALIEILPGYAGVRYSRMYYFDEKGKLYFAFIFDKKRENRLYVKDDIVIRYIDENNEVFDYENEMNCNGFDELAFSESYEMLDSFD